MSKMSEISEMYEKRNQAFLDYWKDIDENGSEGKLGIVEEEGCWFLLTGRDLTFDKVFGPSTQLKNDPTPE